VEAPLSASVEKALKLELAHSDLACGYESAIGIIGFRENLREKGLLEYLQCRFSGCRRVTAP